MSASTSTVRGVGIGLRAAHVDEILARGPAVDWFELIAENYMVAGGRALHGMDQRTTHSSSF